MEQVRAERIEKIDVYIRFKSGLASCICMTKHKRCNNRHCLKTVVTRDRFGDWKETAAVNRFGLCQRLFIDDED